MATQKRPLIIGNWKMNPPTEGEALLLAKAIVQSTKKIDGVVVGITPPLLFITAISKLLKKSAVRLGVQHIHPGPVGAFTGEVSPAMCMPFGVSYALVGHSERRALGMTDGQINAAVLMLLKQKLTPVVCIGERERDAQANFYTHIETQIKTALESVPAARYRDVVIAYEPIWAIGTGATATPADVQEMKLFIQKVLTKLGGRQGAAAVTILYGGSVTSESARVLYTEGGIHGFLVGGASLKPAEFLKIIQSTLN